jgi:curli biogenesis system outer membrane secretion channel CsgG
MALSRLRSTLAVALTCGLGLLVVGCGSSRTSYEQDEDTANVGVYAPPPAGIERLRVGVPPFTIPAKELGAETAAVAADQITTLMIMAQRFDVIERAQLDQLLKEQGLEGIVRADEAAQAGKVRGVDAIVIGKITNFQVKKEQKKGGFGLVNIGNVIGGLDVKKDTAVITVEVGVDLRLVDPTTGSIKAAHFGEYKRTDSTSGFGVQILGASADADASLDIDEDNKGKLLRLALDSTMKKMLPQVDMWLVERSRKPAAE